MLKIEHLMLYQNCVMFGNYDEEGNFYYYELVRYYKDIHDNDSLNKCFIDLLYKYNKEFNIEIIDNSDKEF